ncbi:MAG TPA: BrnA antitoxin family protein [Sedimentisphaerales bacterium]|nr:BrnA antitoxin family protein [Sedimentisphaerales bacterium]HRS11744.1 BrnA antitoxin family protein [Sedimentisphaerales bacterium]HRV48408.1 BrnA antitoxin family protein [Sedimentisphaerales bacterium]
MKRSSSTKKSRTDWERLGKMSDKDIDTSEIAELDEEFFRNAQVHLPVGKQLISLRLDRDVLDWFKQQGKGYQTKINAILRAYIRAHAE